MKCIDCAVWGGIDEPKCFCSFHTPAETEPDGECIYGIDYYEDYFRRKFSEELESVGLKNRRR